ncbi:uncharacterized protein LOC131194340 [Ahaetulla prasina]|uniref:uncharacterized protein LOC131194340 n=1 Tax=Ahaetulla prasina TaxID=499056 RepID=UPI0026495078|nr:uncharacterized protein LOC131194340 [Ahaetulla prasina]
MEAWNSRAAVDNKPADGRLKSPITISLSDYQTISTSGLLRDVVDVSIPVSGGYSILNGAKQIPTQSYEARVAMGFTLRDAGRTQAGGKPSAGVKKAAFEEAWSGGKEEGKKKKKKKPRRCAENPGQAAGIGGGLFPGRHQCGARARDFIKQVLLKRGVSAATSAHPPTRLCSSFPVGLSRPAKPPSHPLICPSFRPPPPPPFLCSPVIYFILFFLCSLSGKAPEPARPWSDHGAREVLQKTMKSFWKVSSDPEMHFWLSWLCFRLQGCPLVNNC